MHKLNHNVINRFKDLWQACKNIYELLLIYDNTKKDFNSKYLPLGCNYKLFDVYELSKYYDLTRISRKASIIPGNCYIPLLDIIRRDNKNQYFWLVEYDVYFKGNWKTLFNYFDDDNSDLLGTTLFRYSFRPDWIWWKSLQYRGKSISQEYLIRGFFPLYRLSKLGGEIIEQALRDNWKGHQEVIVPTVLNYYGCKIQDIGGDGPFVKSKNINRFYLNTPFNPGLAPGTFVYKGAKKFLFWKNNKLYHPVKN